MGSSDVDLEGVRPSAPLPEPCLSYWQRTTRAFPHLNRNHNAPLPSRKRYVIVGSGLSGALSAFELTENGVQGEDIIILEAREAASGASSRNAGHVRPDAFRGFKRYSSLHGQDQALKVIANERLVLDRIGEFVRKHHIECDFNLTTTFDVCLTAEFAAYEAETFMSFKNAGGDVSHVNFFEGEEARKRTGVNKTVAAYEWPAASIHPARLTHWLLDTVINRGVSLFTHCPVSKVERSPAVDEKEWQVRTPRGTVTTPTVIHCTNAYASLLLPSLNSYLAPNRAQAHSLVASNTFSGSKTLTNTLSLRYSLNHFYSLIQCPGDGTLILGVSRTNPTLSAETLRGIVTFDDGGYNEDVFTDVLKQWNVLFPGEDANRDNLDHAWTGIIGVTDDSIPFVGPLENLDGQWICAGFGGHGMARIFNCAPGVVKLILGSDWSDTALPECFQLTTRRVAKMQSLHNTTDRNNYILV